jgi:large subunit ribosomal protein L33
LTNSGGSGNFPPLFNGVFIMREHIILECTEAKAEGKPVSRYFSTKNKKLQKGRLELKKYNPFLRRHTLHRETK